MTVEQAPRRHPRRKIRVRRVLAWLAIAAVLAVPIEFVVWKVQSQANTERLCPPLEDGRRSADPARFAMDYDGLGAPLDFGPYALSVYPNWVVFGRQVMVSVWYGDGRVDDNLMKGGDSWVVDGFGTISIAWVKPFLLPVFAPDGSAFVCITPEDPAFVADYNR